MSGIDAETKKQFEELQKKMVDARSRLQITEMQIRTHSIAVKKNELTTGEIDKLEDSSRMFRGVGRMFMLESKAETVERLAAESDESKGAAATCQKEKAYLQRTYKESEEALRELLRNR